MKKYNLPGKPTKEVKPVDFAERPFLFNELTISEQVNFDNVVNSIDYDIEEFIPKYFHTLNFD